jgi:hypothetical protein
LNNSGKRKVFSERSNQYSLPPNRGVATVVLIILNEIKFDASKFETRTMPTPDMKGKETIYWILVETQDKRLVTDLQRFLGGASQYLELRVPSAFIAVRTELESYKAQRLPPLSSKEEKGSPQLQAQSTEEKYSVEIVLRRQLPEVKTGQTQAPYG